MTPDSAAWFPQDVQKPRIIVYRCSLWSEGGSSFCTVLDKQLLDVIKQGFPVLHLGIAVTVPRLPVAVMLKEMLQRFHLRHDAGERQRQL